MSVAPPRRSLSAFRDAGAIAAAIRQDGGRLSATCQIVINALFAADRPVSAAEIASGLGRGIDLDSSSVYRNLQRLEELGVVARVQVADGPRLYALQDGRQREYLACHACGHLESVDPLRLDRVHAEIHAAFRYETRFAHFALIGLCPRWADGDPAPPPPADGKPRRAAAHARRGAGAP